MWDRSCFRQVSCRLRSRPRKHASITARDKEAGNGSAASTVQGGDLAHCVSVLKEMGCFDCCLTRAILGIFEAGWTRWLRFIVGRQLLVLRMSSSWKVGDRPDFDV